MTSSVTPQITIEKALSKAKIGMMMLKDTVFFSTLCLSLDLILDESIGTAATDGTRLIISPSFFLGFETYIRFLVPHQVHPKILQSDIHGL